MQAIIDNFPGGISMFDKTLHLVAYNEEFKRVLDFPEELFSDGHPSLERMFRFNAARGEYGPGDPEEQVRSRLALAANPKPHVFERTRKDGAALEVRGTPIASGGFVTTYVDISERKRTVALLAALNAHLEAFVRHAPAAVAMFDRDMHYIAHTDRWVSDYRLEETSLVGRSHYDVFPEIPERWKEIHRRCLDGAMEAGTDDLFKRLDGRKQWLRWAIRPWKTGEGAIGGIVMFTEDITERRALEGKLWDLANIDSLTGLSNRMLFGERLAAAIRSTERTATSIAVVLLDIDNFKEINDTLGHDAGDDVLRQVAQRVSASLRETDTVARLGGDEFAIILTNVNDAIDLRQPLQTILSSVQNSVVVGGTARRCAISLGVTICPKDGVDASTLLKNADIALYRAKVLGRNRFEFFEPAMRDAIDQRMTVLRDVESALSDEAVCLFYQPIISLTDGSVRGFEALLRWEHPEKGLISPVEFPEAFEDLELAASIGRRVLELASRQAHAWSRIGVGFGRISINVAAADFHNGTLVDRITHHLDAFGIDGKSLCIEVTEGLFLGRGSEAVHRALEQIRELGVEIALDDFGTGYASLTHLKHLPIDELKIDRSFVADMHVDQSDAAIVAAVIRLGHSLGKRITAEGVEHRTQMDMLATLGCDQMQGYLVARPMHADRVPEFLNGFDALLLRAQCSAA